MNLQSLARQRGLNLIELMIAVVIGLFISLMVVQYLSTSSRLFKQQGVDGNLQANGTFAISYLSQFVRQAGSYNPVGSEVPFFVNECAGTNPCTYDRDASGESDQIAVQMVPQNRRDCVGNPTQPEERIANVFSINGGSLFCRGYSVTNNIWLGVGETLIDGIDQMQVLYGVSNNDGIVDRYVDASRVAAAGLDDLQVQEAWDRIRSVKIALLVSDGENTSIERPGSPTYTLLDSAPVTYTDRVLRKVFETTVTINNKLP